VSVVDLVPQFADFGLQAESVEWSVVSGVVGNDVHISIRNVGYVRSAGEVAHEAFGELGSAGGHRTMAKAVIALDRLGGMDDGENGALQERVIQRFLHALGLTAKG
jgi:nanoRNase/pAp phosphatase (c-di-AMP/oligoRNAs hydrolase)